MWNWHSHTNTNLLSYEKGLTCFKQVLNMFVLVFCTNKQANCVRIMKYIYQTRCVWNLDSLYLFHRYKRYILTMYSFPFHWFHWFDICAWLLVPWERVWIEVAWINNPLYLRILGTIMIFGIIIKDGARSENLRGRGA